MFYQPHLNAKADEILMYLRKSRSDDPLLTDEEVLSKHEAILDDWTEKHLGFTVPAINRFKEVVSGETIDDRPEMLKVLKQIESPKYKAIICVEVQRLSRGDLEDNGRLIKLLRYSNTIVITPTKTYDIGNDYDRDIFERELKRGNEFLEYTKKILLRGRVLSVAQGNYIGSLPPYGYEKITITEGKEKYHTLNIKEDEANVVRMIFDMYVNQDMGRTTICNKLDELGIAPPRGKRWSPASLKDMTENVIYIGKVKWNWRKGVKVVEDGVIVEKRPKSQDYQIYDGKHEAIISEELFLKARDKQGKNYRAKPNTRIRNPLAGLLWCKCGKSMSLRTYKKDGIEKADPRLICDGQAHCHTGSILYKDMLDYVSGILQSSIDEFEVLLANDNNHQVDIHLNLIKTLEQRKADIEARELSQWEAQAHPDPAQRMPAHIFQQLNERLQKEKNDIIQALYKAYEATPQTVNYEEKITKFTNALKALSDPTRSAQEQNRLLKACIDRIDYDREAPQMIKNPEKRVRINGRRVKANPLKTGANWTNPPFKADVKLRV